MWGVGWLEGGRGGGGGGGGVGRGVGVGGVGGVGGPGKGRTPHVTLVTEVYKRHVHSNTIIVFFFIDIYDVCI